MKRNLMAALVAFSLVVAGVTIRGAGHRTFGPLIVVTGLICIVTGLICLIGALFAEVERRETAAEAARGERCPLGRKTCPIILERCVAFRPPSLASLPRNSRLDRAVTITPARLSDSPTPVNAPGGAA